jgi:phospholipase C
MTSTKPNSKGNDYVVSRAEDKDEYELWRFDPQAEFLLEHVEVKDPKLDADLDLTSIGGYLIRWTKVKSDDSYEYPYRLFEFDPDADNPLDGKSIQSGVWDKGKFWGSVSDFGNPDGAKKHYDGFSDLVLLPLDNFLLNFIPSTGRGTFRLWNFDPGSSDPLPSTPYFPQGSFDTIQAGHCLLPIAGFVLDVKSATGDYRLWTFDPEQKIPLAEPVVQQGGWSWFTAAHQMIVVGEHVLTWLPSDRSYQLWSFDPQSEDPLTGPVRSGHLPDSFGNTTSLSSIEDRAREHSSRHPGSIEFMRSKIKHVVHYMIENRSFDHVCGWLYENEKDAKNIQFIGPDRPFDGASTDYYNMNGDEKVHLSKYQDGKLGKDFNLDLPTYDPYHDHSDVMRQMFNGDMTLYEKRQNPNMQGFIWNNGASNVMQTYTPTQLPVLTGLAREFGVSDEWFCSMPGGTDVNRAFSLTGSALGQLNNFQNGAEYAYWYQLLHRPSIWKTLWSNGIRDWKIYNSVEWLDFVFTYHLFLQGQIPTVDQNTAEHISNYDQFVADAENGNLPAFSYLEPVWIAKTGTTSYHPGPDVIPGERRLADVYAALRKNPKKWEETLLVITFDEHGGLFDHVRPPYAHNPYPGDVQDGFAYDIMGVRIPTILVSPWIAENTVFRSETDVAFDATSFLATLLQWFGVPRARWGLGQRTRHAPTFEAALSREEARKDTPKSFEPPYDENYPRGSDADQPGKVDGLHTLMTSRLLHSQLASTHSPAEVEQLSKTILSKATDTASLHELVSDTVAKTKKRGSV